MQQFIEYIDNALPAEKGNEIMFKFKRKVLDNMNSRYNQVMTRGISNQNVIADIVMDEHSDLQGEYKKYYTEVMGKKRARQRLLLNVVGSVLFILILLVAYLGISFTTMDWAHTWVLMVDGILLWIVYLLTLGVKKISGMRRIFHIFARVLLAIDIMVLTVAVFLLSLTILHISHSWVIVIGGIMSIFIADGIFAGVTKQKFAIMNYLIYIPVVATMLYIVLGGIGLIAWNTGWLLIIAGLLIDIIVIIVTMSRNKSIEQEVMDAWKEN